MKLISLHPTRPTRIQLFHGYGTRLIHRSLIPFFSFYGSQIGKNRNIPEVLDPAARTSRFGVAMGLMGMIVGFVATSVLSGRIPLANGTNNPLPSKWHRLRPLKRNLLRKLRLRSSGCRSNGTGN